MKKLAWIANLLIVLALVMGSGSAGVPKIARAAENNPEPQAVDAMPPPTIVFPGIQRPDNPADPDIYPADPALNNDPRTLGAVPDTAGAAGHTHYLQAVNKMVALYRKNGVLVDMSTFADFWTGAVTGTICDDGALHHGQPSVLYDHLGYRWVVADVAYSDIDDGPYYICVAVSNGLVPPAPPAAYFVPAFWNYYAISSNQGNFRYYPDSPKLGLWPDGIYVAADMVDIFNKGFMRTPRGVKVWALNREDLIACPDTDFDGVCDLRFLSYYMSEQQGFEHLVPSNLIGLPPATGTPNYFASIQPNKLYIWEFQSDWNEVTGTFGTGSTHQPNFTLATDTAPLWAIGYLVPQINATERLDAHGERLMSPLQYRIVDGIPSLWTTHALKRSTTSDITDLRWYELHFAEDNVPFFFQQGTQKPDSRYRWMSSLAVDKVGDMAIGFSISSPIMNPAINYAGRLKTDPPGVLAQGEAVFRVMGFPVYNGSQYDGDLEYDGPWGRQSQMSVDPLDECVFWYTNMYYDGQSAGYQWRTAIGWFSFPQCKGGTTKRISLSTQDIQGNASSGLDFETYSVGASGNGRYVVFSSEATNLVSGDTNGHRDVFLRDRDTDNDGIFDEPGFVRTDRISQGFDGSQANGDSWEVSISYSGTFIAFSSDASNIINGDNNGVRDVFVYDRSTQTTERVSVRDQTDTVAGNAQSDQPFISSTGQFVVFRSVANNLVNGDTNAVADIFLRDLYYGRTYRISIPDGALAAVQANGESATPTISNNGQFVAFASKADNLTATADDTGTPFLWDVFVRDWINDVTTLASVTLDAGDLGESYTPYISGNSRFVAFASRSYSLNQSNLVPPEVAGDYDADIFVYDRLAPLANPPISYVSVNFFGDQARNGDSYSPSITSDGRYIAFASEANNLDVHLPDLNARRDIFLHDRTLGLTGVFDFGLTQRISLSYTGGEPNEWSFVPVIAPQHANSVQVAYVSEATNLVNNDTNNVWDVFAFNSERVVPVFLSIPANIPGSVGQPVDVPVMFDSNGYSIDSTSFSIDFDQKCLSFDYQPGSVSFNTPPDFNATWIPDPSDPNGEIDVYIYDNVPPRSSLPTSTLMTIRFTVKAACNSAPGTTSNARVGFSNNPSPSFGSSGLSVPGYASDGFVRILPGVLGDCNGDGFVNAGDLSALVLELFDGDGTLPSDTPGGSFGGNPVGCNPNQDVVVDAGDLSCTVLIIWGNGSAACAGTLKDPREQYGLSLQDTALDRVTLAVPDKAPIKAGQQINLPVSFNNKGYAVASLVFSIDFDETWLSFDGADRDGNGLPDAIRFNLPEGFQASATFDPQDTDGEVDVVVYHPGIPQASLPSQQIMTITLTAGHPSGTFIAAVKSSGEPQASFGSVLGESLPGRFINGSVMIFDKFASFIFLPVTQFTP